MKFLLILLITMSPLLALPSSKEAKEWQELAKKICGKTSDCMKKSAEKLPPDQKKMFLSMIPPIESCVSNKNGSPDPTEPSQSFSKEDLEAMKKCVKDMNALTCEQLMEEENQPKSCERFNQ